MNKEKIKSIYEALSKNINYLDTELNYTNNFTLLVAVVLSAQATDKSVNIATKELFKIVKTPEGIIELGEEKLKTFIKSIGLFNSKAKNVMALSKKLIDEYNSEVPSAFDDLVSLPGVGRKTANVILNIAFGQGTIAVDTHVFRVSNRIGLVKAESVLETEKELEKTTPEEYKKMVHSLLILHGRYTCKAKNPLCKNCVILSFCEYNKKNI